ncbi:MAG TPA: VTT domain-containing protein [Burkholderiales bacterium]|nr:VTT domain-containing protein [Burkholderiales bacterium]
MTARARRSRIAAGLALVLALIAAYWLLRDARWLFDPSEIQSFAGRLGAWGPAGIVALMVVAILISPVPSAPIALAAGALYGHAWGTLYVLAGAELGALAAFGIARLAGYEALRGWLGERVSAGWLGSQNALMGVVFFSRLLPFVSFDVVSYAAGLTALSAWRFALATLAGIIPASFLLAHFGAEMAGGEVRGAIIAALGLGALVALPVVAELVRRHRASRD